MLHLAWTMIEIWGSNAKVVIVLFVILNMWNTSGDTSRIRCMAHHECGCGHALTAETRQASES